MNPQQDVNPVGIRNWIAFIAFTLAVVFGWQLLFPPPPRPEPPASPIVEGRAEPSGTTEAEVSTAAPEATAEPPRAVEAVQADAVQRLVVRTSHALVEITNVGGRVTSWKLPDHPGYWSADEPVELVRGPLGETESGSVPDAPRPVPDDAPLLPLQLITGDPALDARLAGARHVLELEEVEPGLQRLVARWSDGAGTSVEKVLEFRDDLPLVALRVSLVVDGAARSCRLAWGPGVGDHSPAERKNMYFRRGRLVYRAGGELEREDRPDQAERLPFSTVDWAGLEDSFFTALFVPGVPGEDERLSLREGFRLTGVLPPKESGKAGSKKDWPEYLVLEAPFSPAAPWQTLYVGPRDRDVLAQVEELFAGRRGLVELTDLGAIIGPIARLMEQVLAWLHAHVGNWGVSIILLTLLIRLVLFLPTHVSLKKMRLMQDRMKVAKPRIDAIKSKYRKLPRDMETRQREQAETMEVYRQVGINPADQIMGCLPLLVSMPFFFALFRLLQGAAEFRHQSFLLWPDLSAADPTHVWPILTGATTFVSQKLSMSQSSGSSEMESVQRNMLFMFPIMFVFFCWSAPLGLVVYWTTNNIIQIGQQYLLKLILPPPAGEQPAPSKNKKNKKPERTHPEPKTNEGSDRSKQGGRRGRGGKRRRR